MKKRTVGVNREIKHIGIIKEADGYFRGVRIHSKKDRPLWTLFLEYFHSLEIGQEFSRSELLYATYESSCVPALIGDMTSIDNYRSYLRKLDFITYIKPGLYRKEKDIPVHVTLSDVNKAIKNLSTWKGWFQPLHDQLGIKEEDLK